MNLEKAIEIFRALAVETVGWVDDMTDQGRTSAKYAVRLDAGYAGSEDPEERRYYTMFVRTTNVVDNTVDAIRYVFELAEEHGVQVSIENDGIRIS